MTVYRLRSEGLQWRDIAGEAIVVDVRASMYLTANAAGTMLWHELERGATADSLIERLVAAFGIDAERARRDVEAFLHALRERGMLEPAEDA